MSEAQEAKARTEMEQKLKAAAEQRQENISQMLDRLKKHVSLDIRFIVLLSLWNMCFLFLTLRGGRGVLCV